MKAIITYHSIDTSGSVISVHPERFRTHMEVLREKDVPVLPLAEVASESCEDGVAITFDDAFENLASDAWPVLRECGFPATVFVPSDWMGRDNGWDPDDDRIPRLPLMDWETLRGLVADGLDVGSHTRSHPKMTELSADELTSELEGSREAIETETGQRPVSFAYPYGIHDGETERAVEAAGYECAVTVELRVLAASEPSRYALPRLDAYYLAKPGVMEGWGTGGFHRYLRFRHAARRLRSKLRGMA